MKLFVGAKKPPKAVDVCNQGIKAGVAVGRFKIDRHQAEHIRILEKTRRTRCCACSIIEISLCIKRKIRREHETRDANRFVGLE